MGFGMCGWNLSVCFFSGLEGATSLDHTLAHHPNMFWNMLNPARASKPNRICRNQNNPNRIWQAHWSSMFFFSLQVFQESEAHFAGISLLSSSPANWSHMSCHGCAAIQWHVNRRSPVRNPEGCNLSWESWPWCCILTALPQYSPLDHLVHAVGLSSNSYKGFGRGFIS